MELCDEEHYELYNQQQQQQYTNQQQQHHQQQQQHHHQQQLPQTNKRLEKLKKLKIREIQSLALEGGDTGRGYCSCDEQWTGSTSSATSSPTSVSSPPAAATLQQQAPSLPQSQSQCQLQLQQQYSNENTTTPSESPIHPSSPLSPLTTRTIIMTTTTSAAANTNIEMNEKTSENGSGTNDATGGSGYNRTNKQCNGSAAAMTTASLLLLKQQNLHQQQQKQQQQQRENEKINMMEKFNETNFAEVGTPATAPSTAGASTTDCIGSGSIKTITLRRNPIQQRLKQQHHVRFSDEKNFSD